MKKKIVIIGGGTSTATLLSGLKMEPSFALSAILPVTDSGGSSRAFVEAFARMKANEDPEGEDLHVVPPGDAANALLALSHQPGYAKELLNYRFTRLHTQFEGHSLRNLIVGAAMELWGTEGIARVCEMFGIEGRILPASTESLRLVAEMDDGSQLERYSIADPAHPDRTIDLEGEEAIDHLPYQDAIMKDIVGIRLKPYGKTMPGINPDARDAIAEADIILLAPSDLWTSTIPILAVPGMSDALQATNAVRCYLPPLMSKKYNTAGYSVADLVSVLERYSFPGMVDVVLHNSTPVENTLLAMYAEDGAAPISLGERIEASYKVVEADLIDQRPAAATKGDIIRSIIRHDPAKVLSAVRTLVERIA